jgi:hypothetical protein
MPTVGKVEYNYALMSSINYTDEAIIKDAERETADISNKKRPCGTNFNRSGYATAASEIHDGEENMHNPDAWKGPQSLIDRDIDKEGDRLTVDREIHSINRSPKRRGTTKTCSIDRQRQNQRSL